MNEDFDDWLERRLSSGFSTLNRSAGAPEPLRTSIAGSKRMRFVPALPAAVSAKALAGFTVAALATGTGVAAVSDATGHSTFGKDVAQKAQWCAQHMSRGQIGDCVSDFVLAHNPGASQRSDKAQPDASTHGQSGSGTGNPTTAPPTNPSNAATTHKAPVSHPTGKP